MATENDTIGPRGGISTSKRGQRKKVFWLDEEICEALRRQAFDNRTSEVALVREALKRFLDVSD